MRTFYLPGLLCCLVSPGVAAQDSTSVTTLKEVVVSASRAEQPVIEVPRSVTVISERDIRNSIYQSVGELLNAYSGLYVVGANQTPGTNQNIFMRGANSNQVAVMIDGVRITDPSSPNAAIDFSEISLINVERVEVIRGSHSTIFGGAAVGGVINIITKKNDRKGLHGNVSWQGGYFGRDARSSTETAALSYGAENGMYVSGSLFRQDVRGLDASEDNPLSPSFSSDNDDFQKTDASLKAGFRNERWDASLSFRNADQHAEIDDGAFVDDENSYLDFGRRHYQYQGLYNLNDRIRLTLVGSFSESERAFKDDSSRVSQSAWDHVFTSGSYYGRLQTHELQMNYSSGSLQGVVGAGAYREKMFFNSYLLFNDPQFPYEATTNYDSINALTTTGYLFAQLSYAISDFNVAGGARLSHHSTAGNFLSFELNPSFALNDILIYGSLSTGFNAPSLYQLFDPSKSFGAYAARGNRELEPEQSLSLEFGVKKQFASGSYLTLSAYRTTVKNSIEYVYLWNGEKPVEELDFSDDRGDRYINVGEQMAMGIEMDGAINLGQRLFLQGNISVLESEVSAGPEDADERFTGGNHIQLYNIGRFLDAEIEDREVVRRPSFTANARLNYRPLNDLRFDVIYRYAGNRFDATYSELLGPYGALARVEVGKYHLVDIGLSWDATSSLVLSLKVENVFDIDYREVAGFHTRGRSGYLKAAIRF